MNTIQFGAQQNQTMPSLFSFPPLKKGGQGGFSPPHHSRKSPSIPLFQRGKQLARCFTLAIALILILATASFLHAQNLPAIEKQKIETLIKRVGDLKDGKFVRNGSAYESKTAVRFLRGKWSANSDDVKSAHDFIDKVASMSGTSGKPYLIRFKDGKEIKSSEFLLAELKKLESESAATSPSKVAP